MPNSRDWEAYSQEVEEQRDRARTTAVRLEQENAYLHGFLQWMRDELNAHGGVLLTIDDIVQAIDEARAEVAA